MLSVTTKPDEWIKDMTHNRARKAGDIIYKQEFDHHLENGTLPPNATKASLILAHEFPVVTEPDTREVIEDPMTTELNNEKVKTKNLEALVLSLITRVQKLEAR
jgi:hypothetical protein